MKIKPLLNVHISPEVAAALRRQFPGLDVKSIHDTDWSALAVAGFVCWRMPSKQKMQSRQGRTALLI